MLSADGLSFTAGSSDPALIRTSPVAPLTPEYVFVGDEDLGVLSEPVTFPFVPYEDTFSLHSNPTSPFTIYLDFDGHRTENTGWNAILEDPLTGQDINSPPYDIDGDVGVFSDQELENIQEAFLRVSEDFAPFNVNVTTEEPEDLDDLTRTGRLDERWGIRVVSGGSTRDWLTPDPDEPGAGGVAFLFSFNDPIDTPAFAFSESGWASGKNLAEVISHEVGHTLGLSHDGLLAQPGWDPDDPLDPRAPVEYYAGQGDWAPIMGVAYGPEVSQWSQGEYFGASNDQDDLAIITGLNNGIGYRADDQPGVFIDGTVFNPTELEREPPTVQSIFENSVVYKQQGIIERNTDTDYYNFYSNAGPITIEALPAAVGANLDIKIELLDSSGNVLATGNPDNDLTATLSATAFIPDFYTLAITGDASQAVPQPVSVDSTDYTDYGSLGQYAVTISAALGPQPDAYEKNDFAGEAYEVPYADYTLRGSIHQGEPDFYRWTAGETGSLKVFLDFVHSTEEGGGDLNLEVLDQNGIRIPGEVSNTSFLGTDDEYLELDVVANQSYYIRVWASGTTVVDDYELWLDGPGIPLDGFRNLDAVVDPNSRFASSLVSTEETVDLESQFTTLGFEFDDVALKSELGPVESNDTPSDAFFLRPGPTTGGGSLPDYSLDLSIHRPDDNDYFLWTSPGTGKLILDLGFDHSQANIDTEVRRANLDNQGTLVSSVPLPDGVAESTDDDEQVIVDVVAGDTYLIRVYATPTAGTAAPGDATYTFNLDGPELDFDNFELNNTLAQANNDLNGQTGITPNLSIHSEIDVDYFRWTAPETGDFRARAFFFHENGDLDLSLLDAGGSVLATSTSVNDNESVTERVIAGRDYFVKVYGFQGATQANYALDMAFAPAPPLPGDYDGNGFVDILDRTIWDDTFGANTESLPPGETTLRADGNDDGFVDLIDYVIWRDNLGAGREPEFASVIANPGKAAEASSYVVFADPVVTAPVAEVVLEGAIAPTDGPIAAAQLLEPIVPLAETFTLHSNPDSNFTIYLDFDGHITSDPLWLDGLNSVVPGEGSPARFGLPFFTPAYDIDGAAAFSDQELLNIQEAYLRVAEDFAPFDLNVTTEQPPRADLENAGGDDDRWGVRVVIGGSTFDWLSWPDGGGAGGVALLNSFALPSDTPAYAFMEGAGGPAKNIAEVVSHEVGHTLGLNHDGNFLPLDPNDEIDPEEPPMGPEVNEYYPGHENNLWGPIMGAAYGPTITQWSKGEYFLANRGEFAFGMPNGDFEDDLSIITGGNGFGYRVDDHGDELESATTLEADFEGIRYDVVGIIEQNTDTDYLSFRSEAGTVVVDAMPALIGANLDIRLEVYDSEGMMVALDAPDFDQTASVEFEVATPGIYHVAISGDAYAESEDPFGLQLFGYSDYGSLGEYTLAIVTPPAPIQIPPPDAFEPNNTLEEPYDLITGDYFLPALTRHEIDDDDVFLWTASADGTLLIDALFSHEEADLDIEVFRVVPEDDPVLIAAGLSTTDNESVTLQVTVGTQYLIRVDAAVDAKVDSYSLRIDGPGDSPDQFELNNTAETATTLSGATVDEELSLHFAGDEDYFQWQATADDTLRVEVAFNQSTTDVKVQVIDPETMAVLDESAAVEGSEVVQVATETGLVYLVRVYSDSSDPSRQFGDYRLLVNGAPLTGDALEPNNPGSEAGPTIVTSNKVLYDSLSIHTTSDIDVFQFTAPTTGVWRVTAEFLHAFGDLDMALSDGQGLIAEATTPTNNETIVARLRSGETYWLEVFGYQNALVGSYSLDTLFTPTPPTPGDFNDDGVVGQLDRIIWASSFGETGSGLDADANEDGVVDAADYSIFRDNLGTTTTVAGLPISSNPVIPQAATLVERPTSVATGVAVAVAETPQASDQLTIAPTADVFERALVTPTRESGGVATSVADATELLLIGARDEVPEEEPEVGPVREDSQRSRDDAFAELAVGFDRIG